MKRLLAILLTLTLLAGFALPAAATAGHSWAGRYSWMRSFFTGDPTHHTSMRYIIEITADEDGYTARIDVDRFRGGARTELHMLADVRESENQIELIFAEHLPGCDGDFEPGDVLLTFIMQDGTLMTQWGALQPVLLGGSTEPGRFFGFVRPLPTTPLWWQTQPAWLQFLLRWLAFGWIWM